MPNNTTISALSVAVSANVPVILWGPPGSGKTTTIADLAASSDLPLEVVIASIREPSDFAGLPYVTNGAVSLAPPSWAVRLVEQGKGIVFLDELSTAPPAVQAALLRVPIERVVGDIALPADVRVIAAANRQSEAAGTWELSAPTANRFCHLAWDPTATSISDGFLEGFPTAEMRTLRDDWRAAIPRAKTTIGAFLRHRPALASALPDDSSLAGEAWPSPRSWEMAATLIAATEALQTEADAVSLLISGSVGSAAAHEFLTWCSELDLPDPEDVLADPSSFTLPRRNDRAFAVLAAVVSVVAENPTPPRWEQAWALVQRYLDAGKHDVAALAAKQLARCRPAGAKTGPTIEALLPILEEAGLA